MRRNHFLILIGLFTLLSVPNAFSSNEESFFRGNFYRRGGAKCFHPHWSGTEFGQLSISEDLSSATVTIEKKAYTLTNGQIVQRKITDQDACTPYQGKVIEFKGTIKGETVLLQKLLHPKYNDWFIFEVGFKHWGTYPAEEIGIGCCWVSPI